MLTVPVKVALLHSVYCFAHLPSVAVQEITWLQSTEDQTTYCVLLSPPLDDHSVAGSHCGRFGSGFKTAYMRRRAFGSPLESRRQLCTPQGFCHCCSLVLVSSLELDLRTRSV